MVTFSRGLYLAYGLTVSVVLVALFRKARRAAKFTGGTSRYRLIFVCGALLWRAFALVISCVGCFGGALWCNRNNGSFNTSW